MSKNILQDVIPPEKRSIRNIPVPARMGKPVPPMNSSVPKKPQQSEQPKVYQYENESYSSGSGRKWIWIAVGLALVIVFFAVLSLFKGATITIVPTQEVVASDGTTVLSAALTADVANVSYQIVTISKELGQTVETSGEEHVEEKASGRIIIYNTFDANPQRLIKNTRFETPEGLIYRINESVVVPGRTGQGAQMTPGSIEVTVYADEPGEKYNVGLKDFTIPGFKDDPRFKAVYARSKGEMSGGFVGNVKKVAPATLTTVQAELEAALIVELEKEAVAQLPKDFILYSGGMFYSFEALPQSDAKGSSVVINRRGILNGVIFNREELSKYLAENLATNLPKSDVMISNIESLAFAIENKESLNPKTDVNLKFTVSGPINFVSQFDAEKIMSDVAGQPKKNLNEIMTNYPTIERASAVVRPFWKRAFPTDIKNIKIEAADLTTNEQ
jgi:hypothetical protein